MPAITLPATAPNLTDLNLDGNELTEIDLSKFPKLFALSLVNNKLKTFDLSPAKSLGLAYLSGNKMKEIKFDNPTFVES